MSHGPPHSHEPAAISLQPDEGWHCSHFYYAFDRGVLASMHDAAHADARREILEILDPEAAEAPERLQTSVVAGDKADFGLMLMDPDPLRIESVNQRLLSSRYGPALKPCYSFVSMTEISEYVPSLEQYAERLRAEGEEEESAGFKAKMKAYEGRLPAMNQQRLTPEFPAWPATCFYPMNKKREVGENWFLTEFDQRNRLMAEHARSGMQFAGKVSQLITVGVGLEDWEWGVTLWARNPQFLKEIVYKKRFDEASARYAEFGLFYTSYITTAVEMLSHCRVGV